MKKVWIIAATLLFSTLFAQYECCEDICALAPSSRRIIFRHTEGKGIGYNQGYTTAEGFFSYIPYNETWIPFLDARVHIFNDGRPAGNVGLGLRYVGCNVWGIAGYYDFRKTHSVFYNQASLCLESLGKILDFRLNGYLPLGKTQSSFKTSFDHFEGNFMILSRKRDVALRGANAEVGVHMYNSSWADLYGALGPYYFGNGGSHAWGGQGRIALNITKYLQIAANASYDNLFKWIAQGQIGLVIPFGPCCQSQCGKSEVLLCHRALQPVDREEIVVVHKNKHKEIAIDPATGLPLFFLFVDNTSNSLGTFESPYSNLAIAQSVSKPHDNIYVYPGDGTSRGLNTGFIFKDYQRLLGAGIAHPFLTTHGIVEVPALASGLPFLSFTGSTDPVAILASHCELSGFFVNNPTSLRVIVANGRNAAVTQNTVVVSLDHIGVSFFGNLGQSIMTENTMLSDTGVDDAWGVEVNGEGGTLQIANNMFAGINNATGFTTSIKIRDTSNSIIEINNNQFLSKQNTFAGVHHVIDIATPGVLSGAPFEINILNNSFGAAIAPNREATIALFMSNDFPCTLRIVNNYINESSANPAVFEAAVKVEKSAPAAQLCLSLVQNIALTPDTIPGYLLINTASPATFLLNARDNIGDISIPANNVTSASGCPSRF